jgi:hypothetical protein
MHNGRHDRLGLTTAVLACGVLAITTAVALFDTADQGSDASGHGSAGVRLKRGRARHNESEQRLLLGTLVQRHEGDWEAVTTGVSRKRPLFVANSAHVRRQLRALVAEQRPGRQDCPPVRASRSSP